MLKEYQLSSSLMPIITILGWEKNGELCMDQSYQRGDVWGATRRQNLIKSLLIGVPIPTIIVNDRFSGGWKKDGRYAVIDGKQRCTTILMFMKSELSIPGHWVDMNGEVVFKDIPVHKQRHIKLKAIPCCTGQLPSIEDEIEIFNLINYGGVPQGQSDFSV